MKYRDPSGHRPQRTVIRGESLVLPLPATRLLRADPLACLSVDDGARDNRRAPSSGQGIPRMAQRVQDLRDSVPSPVTRGGRRNALPLSCAPPVNLRA
jgi:hypothetical protein